MSSLQTISNSSLSTEAFDKLVEAITSGEFEPGQRLSEAELARALGISRGPLREALGRLEGRLVTRTPRIGVHVIELSYAKLDSLYRAREALEGMAARVAAENINESQLRELRQMLQQHSEAPEITKGEAYVTRSHDDDFHLAIIKAAQSETIERLLMNEVYYQLRVFRHKSSTQPGRARAALQEHFQILEALEARNPDRAEQEVRTHLRNARLSSVAALRSRLDAPDPYQKNEEPVLR